MNKKLNKDFADFVSSKPNSSGPESQLDKKILGYVQKDLSPEPGPVIKKLVFVQAFVGLLSMTFCPQFNMSLTNNYDFFHLLHRTFGTHICIMICGAIFVGLGSLSASLYLSTAEISKIRNHAFLIEFLYATGFLVAFSVMSGEFSFVSSVTWLTGALLAGFASLKSLAVIRAKQIAA